MMKTGIALIVKFFVTLAAAWIAFMVFDTLSIWPVLLIAIIATAVNYLVGDLVVLSRYGNTAASILGGIAGGVTAWVVLLFIPAADFIFSTGIIFAIMVAVAEFFFHMYLIGAHMVKAKNKDMELFRKNRFRYNTETGSELNPFSDKEGFDDAIDERYDLGSGKSGEAGGVSGDGNRKNDDGR